MKYNYVLILLVVTHRCQFQHLMQKISFYPILVRVGYVAAEV